MRFLIALSLLIFANLLAGCVSSQPGNADTPNTNLTVGLVQKEISEGMDAVDVIATLGSPNIVKKSEGKPETWIYDKFSSEEIHESGTGALAYVGGNGVSAISGSTGRSSSSTHALTIIIKFSDDNKVNSLAYHRSKF